ncbi:hypothetical protein TKK_0018539 [Trichogramma kaykai]|uniref:snRNA-activating protein complex subunit 3 n=1 Tax=Trichogramma kaykai TaxID=54128 RepID=A0ABD2VZL8_9HYME
MSKSGGKWKSDLDFRSIYEQCYRGSAPIDINNYFTQYRNLIDESGLKNIDKTDKEKLYSLVGDQIDEERYDLLAEYCNPDKLTCPGELQKMKKAHFEWCKDPEDKSIIETCTLKTVQDTLLRNRLKNHQVPSKYKSEKPICYEPHVPSTSSVPRLIPNEDMLVIVRVYTPFTSRNKLSTGSLGKLSINLVVAMLGSQTLDKLRDVISCVSDMAISTEMSAAPIRSHATQMAKNVYKSGFFFIENTFYNDLRDPNNHDNSKVIRDWMKSRNFDSAKTAVMENTRIDSLVLKFGFPWVYQHQGDCEHLISFSNARLVNSSDELCTEVYPRILRIKPRPNRYCMTCGIYNVSWVTIDNNRLPHNPCLFCESCFRSYNYVKGKKIGSFSAYPYPYDSELLEPLIDEEIIKQKPKRKLTRYDSDGEEESIEDRRNRPGTSRDP